jgi:hypothetical protein
MDAIVTNVASLSPLDSQEIVSLLSNSGSDFQAEVAGGRSSRPVAIVRNAEARVAGWANTDRWEGLQTLECYTRSDMRRRGIARAAAALLVADGRIDPRECVAVFEPECVKLAESVGCRDVRLYELRGDEWVLVQGGTTT